MKSILSDINSLNNEILVIFISKSFTTIEVNLNLQLIKEVLSIENKDIIAITSKKEVGDFAEIFNFSRELAGRFSVTSFVGLVPLSLAFNLEMVMEFCEGCSEIDENLYHKKDNPEESIPIMLALIDIFHRNVLGIESKAILPYSEVLNKFPNHIQQLEMESLGKISNGKNLVDYKTGFNIIGESGTKGQHSFYQSLHQGNKMLCDFLFFNYDDELLKINGKFYEKTIDNKNELFANFLAQADGLANGNSNSESDINKLCQGNRPSNVIFFEKFNAKNIGRLLAIYEHRISLLGFLWENC